MPRRKSVDLVKRWEGNPIITTPDLSFPVLDICNAGAVKTEDGEYLLLIRIDHLEGRAQIHLARSRDGYRFEVDDEPVMKPASKGPFEMYETMGVEDPRITRIDGEYYIVYTANSGLGVRLGLAKTKDFKSIKRVALISEPDTKHGALFPRKIKGRYLRLERPAAGDSIWISYSDDLVYWGSSEPVLTPRGGFWDFHRVGAAAPPIEIDEGWLISYHGVKSTSAGPLFKLGVAIADKEDPTQILARSNVPILSPREPYERIGDVNNLVFSTGAILEPDGQLKIYYGGSDSCICVGTASVEEVVERCQEGVEEF